MDALGHVGSLLDVADIDVRMLSRGDKVQQKGAGAT